MEPFSTDELLNTARAQTGLDDFGPSDFMEGFTAFIASINAQGEISDRHREAFRLRMLRHLKNRLWFAADLAAHPEILDEDPGSPVIILSLPRTASTKLHRMLGAAGDFQTLKMWEAHMFARIPGLPDAGAAYRMAETKAYETWMYEVSPEAIKGHAMFTDEVEEDYTLLPEATFREVYCAGIFNVPAYEQWIAQADPAPRNAYFRKQIQYLQWQKQPARALPWLMKSPILIGAEAEMSQLFKKPRFIFTHRDPVKCIPSIANPVQYMRKMYSDHNTAASLGRSLSYQFSSVALAHMQWRDSHPEYEVLDLSMREITEDGIATAQKVYDFLNIPLSAEAKSQMRNWEQRNPPEKHGRNVYSAEGVGTTDDEIRQYFAPYIERFSHLF